MGGGGGDNSARILKRKIVRYNRIKYCLLLYRFINNIFQKINRRRSLRLWKFGFNKSSFRSPTINTFFFL